MGTTRSLWTGCRFELEAFKIVWRFAWRWAGYICGFKKIYIHDVSLKNYLILLAKRNESGSQNDNWTILFKQEQHLDLYPNFPRVPPPPLPLVFKARYGFNNHGCVICIIVVFFFLEWWSNLSFFFLILSIFSQVPEKGGSHARKRIIYWRRKLQLQV